jgi:YD repeat-containing protein
VKTLFFLFGAAALFLLQPPVGLAQLTIDRSQCKQYGGTADCWEPAIGRWKFNVCGEVGTFNSYSIAVCQADGGTSEFPNCLGLPPPELRRPTSETDIVPFAGDILSKFSGPLCEGPTSPGFVWGASIFSNLCFSGNGPVFNRGYEISNNTNFFPMTGKRLSSGQCTNDVGLTFSATRSRPVSCPGIQDQSYVFTTGETPALCSLGFRFPVTPKQCNDCPAIKVGNPIDPISGVKQHNEVDYAGSGPHPLRFERVYHNRVYVVDGRQWRHSYSARIDDHSFGTRPVALAHRPRGRTFVFARIGDQYLPDVDVDDRLTRLTDAGGALAGWQYYEATSDALETYDSNGRLVSIRNRAELEQRLEYSTASTPVAIAPEPGLLIRVTDAFGRQLNFAYDAIGRMTTMQDAAGQTYLYAYDSLGLVTSITFPDGKKRTYLYGEGGLNANTAHTGRLTGIVDENESRFASYSYDIFGLAFRSQHAGNVNTVTVNFASWPNSVTVTDARGTVRTYSYQLINGVRHNSAIAQPAVSGTGTISSATTYDANGNVATRRDWNGNRTNYTYDLARNLETSRTEGLTAAGAVTSATRSIETQWNPVFRLSTQVTEKDGGGAVLRVSDMSYDANGNLLSRTLTAGASSRTWSYTYNANGLVLTMDGPRADVSDVTTYTYYADDDPDLGKRGNVATISNALGHVTQITEYNAHGQPLTIQDPNGLTTTLAYDARQRLISRNVGGETTTYDYDGVGQLTKVTLPDGSFLSYSYDAAHRLTGIADNLGNRIAYALDAMGNRTGEQVLDPANQLAQTRSRIYNSLNRLVQEIGAQAQTTAFAYDNQGNLTSIDGPLPGAVDVTTNAYDALNRLVRVTDPHAGQVNYGYSALDHLTSVSDPRSLVTSYSYDGLNNLNQQVSPDTGTTTNTYDAAGNLLTQTDAKGQVTTYTYDALNRVTSITYQGGVVHAYEYDQGTNGIGRLTRVTEPNSTTQYAYDQKGRLTTETRTINAVAYATSYSYDATGRLTGMMYPSGRQVSYMLDALGRIQQVNTVKDETLQTIVSAVAYRPFGPAQSFTFGNGQTYNRGFDQDGRIASYTLAFQTFAVGYDAASRISFLSDTGNPANASTYDYDNLDRLINAVAPGTPFAYSYDAVGNRSSKTVGSSTDTYAYGATSNRLSSVTPGSGPFRNYVHDATGSVTADGVNTYAYDTRGRLTQAVSVIGATDYRVNSLGQRIRKTSTQSDTVYHYDSQGRLIAETNASGAVQKEYIYLGDIPVAVLQ